MNTKTFVQITTDGVVNVLPVTGDELGAMQRAVGGYIELLHVSPDNRFTVWGDDEARLKDTAASNLVGTLVARTLESPHLDIVGDMLFTGGGDAEGNTLGLTDVDVALLQSRARTIVELLSDIAPMGQ